MISKNKIVRKMLEYRFRKPVQMKTSIEALRGIEGRWMRDLYEKTAEEYQLKWNGRAEDWSSADPVNRALSVANGCLYAVCHAGILAGGFSPAIGFIHTGNSRSFVFDIADLYKPQTTIPLAFQLAKDSGEDIEKRTRTACRQKFY